LIFRSEIRFLEIVELPAESTVYAGVVQKLAIYTYIELVHRTRIDNYTHKELHIDCAV
jgi:hypothetical protein